MLLPVLGAAQWTPYSRMLSNGKEVIVTNWVRGYVELKTGGRKDGEVRLKVIENDTVEVHYKPAKGKKEKYVREEVSEYYGVVLISDIKNDYKQPYKNFHPGTVFLEDRQEWKGKVAMGMREPTEHDGTKVYGPVRIRYANEKDEVIIREAKNSNIIYVIQTIDGTENHYIKVDRQFIEVGNPNGRFSYFRNPNPTHVREGATNMAQGAAEQLTNEAAEALAKAAAKESFERSQEAGKDLGESVGNATVAAMNAREAVQDASNVEDMDAIYFEEYFIVDNKKMTRSVIYKKNIDEVLNAILEGCGMEEKIVDKVGKMKELTEAMIFLEENICD